MYKRIVAPAAVLALGSTLLLTPPTATAASAVPVDGSTALTAAGSCWEVKQRNPSAASGRYWIVTPAMLAPKQIYCDQTTDGGGWALVGRGRERWTEAGDGTGRDGTWMTTLPVDGSNGTMIAKQLPGSDIDGLLNNTRVDALADGVRLRRAKNTSGTSWQEIRFKYAKRDRWTWAFSANNPIKSFTVDGKTSTTSQTSRDMRISNKLDSNRVMTYGFASNKYVKGFTYYSGVKGTTSSTSYLYSAGKGGEYATGFTQMYLRPKLTRDSMNFTAIGSGGAPAVTNTPVASSLALPNTWGVKGLGAGGTDYLATEVSAFAQIGNRIYVGGNFTKVRNNSSGTEYSQPYLAAFDATTGAWDSGFKPKLNNQVKALATYQGRLVVGGEFTSVNGATRRALVTVDAASGATYDTFKTDIAQTTSGARRWVQALLVEGSNLYVGGGFTQAKGGSQTTLLSRSNLARLNAANGTVDSSWAPNLGKGLKQADGKTTVRSSVLGLSMSTDGQTLFAAGRFTQGYVGADGKSAVSIPGAAAITVGTSATFRNWSPRYSSSKVPSHYQQAVKVVGDNVWLGGSQHTMAQYSASTRAFKRGNITLVGGDFQAIASSGGIVYGSCHCNDWNYSDTLGYDKAALTGFTQADRIGYVGAWDAATGDYLPQFAPTSGTRSGEGPWALFVDSNGKLWSGGDYTSIVTTNNKSEWAGGFVRFAPTPSKAPAAPTNLRSPGYTSGKDYAYFGWDASSTPGVSYELLKDNRVVQIMGPGDTYSDTQNYQLASSPGRFFVRAVDAAGNRSATTPVLALGSQGAARIAPEADPASGTSTDLIASGSPWTVTAPGDGTVDPQWASPSYTPSGAWGQATAPIGWGNTRLTSSFDDRPGTFYLRHDFTVDDPAALSSITISSLADDGTALYVNGVEVGRKNLPGGSLSGSTLATATPDDSSSLDWTISVPTSLLVKGRNVVSAQVHPGSSETRDVAFELEMSAQ